MPKHEKFKSISNEARTVRLEIRITPTTESRIKKIIAYRKEAFSESIFKTKADIVELAIKHYAAMHQWDGLKENQLS
jgi:hypothetical protein